MIDYLTINGERTSVRAVTNMIYSTMREANRFVSRDVGRPFYGLSETLQAAWQCATANLIQAPDAPTAEACHRAWQLIFLRNGWRYGERFHRRGKRHPAMRGWNEPDFDHHERTPFLTMATQLEPIWREYERD